MRHDLGVALLVVTWVAWTSSASAKVFNHSNESSPDARSFRVDPDEAGEEERSGGEAIVSALESGVTKAASPMIPERVQKVSEDAARGVTGTTTSSEDVLKKVPGVDADFVQKFKQLPKDRQDDITDFFKNLAQDQKDMNVKKSLKAFKAWHKSATKEEKQLSPAEQLKAAGIVDKSFPSKKLDTLIEISGTFNELNKSGIKKFLKVMAYLGLVSLGALLMCILHWLKGPSILGVSAPRSASE
ncbi:hypothetical protein PsorP6_019118 [Peronosclerospora sorghi]|nr:hypothetical protein PsorP6_019118 [Peronosclerospora sorghi]